MDLVLVIRMPVTGPQAEFFFNYGEKKMQKCKNNCKNNAKMQCKNNFVQANFKTQILLVSYFLGKKQHATKMFVKRRKFSFSFQEESAVDVNRRKEVITQCLLVSEVSTGKSTTASE